jgi:hypothetical protein
MNGAESLVRTLLNGDVNVCFANPGTSEMHFVSALDRVVGVRCILGLFEGVVTGAADGYYRMAGKPAATLLHLGPGLGNGLANLHNAKKARSGIVNIVGCIDTTNSKAKRIVDGVHKPWEVFTDVIPHQVCQNCFVPTGDIEPNASRADLALVRDDASDRHVVPTVTIPAKDRTNH